MCFSAWVKIPKAFTGENNGFRVFVQDGTSKVYIAAVNDTKGEWKKVSAERKVNNPSVTFQLAFVCTPNPIPENTTFYIDDLSIELKSELAMDAAKGFASVDKYCESGNYLYYDALDSDSGKWNATNDAGSWPTAGDFAGTLKVDFSATDTIIRSDFRVKSTYLPVLHPEKTYEASVWVYIPTESEANIDYVGLQARGLPAGGFITSETLSTTNGTWRRLSKEFTPTAQQADGTNKMGILQFFVANKKNTTTTVYFDNLVLVEKTAQIPVLQILKPQLKRGSETDYIYLDAKKPGSGAFVVQYDAHSVVNANEGNALISAIYKETNGVKQLVEVSVACFDADDSKVSVNMQGVESPDSTYTLRTMLWNSLWGMQSLKYTDSMKLN